MITEALDFRYLLFEHYKNLKITENELVVILLIDHLISQGNQFITPDLLSLKMSFEVNEIDKILASLIKKGILEYKTSGKETVCSIAPLKRKLIKDFEISFSKEESAEKNNEVKKIKQEVAKGIEDLLGRKLSPVEVGKVNEWILYGYRKETILEATKESISKNKKTIRSIDKVLSMWQSRNDIETDGITTITPDWNKSLEETIKIAKTPWLDQDDEK